MLLDYIEFCRPISTSKSEKGEQLMNSSQEKNKSRNHSFHGNEAIKEGRLDLNVFTHEMKSIINLTSFNWESSKIVEYCPKKISKK